MGQTGAKQRAADQRAAEAFSRTRDKEVAATKKATPPPFQQDTTDLGALSRSVQRLPSRQIGSKQGRLPSPLKRSLMRGGR